MTSVPQPPQDVTDRFNRSLSEVQTQLMLSHPDTTARLLKEFVASVESPAFTIRLKDEFPSLIAPILNDAGATAGKYKAELSRLFTDIQEKSLTPEARQALDLHSTADAMLNGGLYPGIVHNKITEVYWRGLAAQIDDPDAYFNEPNFSEDAEMSKRDLNILHFSLQTEDAGN